MTLVAEWRRVLRHAWSIRFNALAVVLGAAEVGVPYLSGANLLPPGTFAALAAGVSLAAGTARLMAQSKLPGDA